MPNSLERSLPQTRSDRRVTSFILVLTAILGLLGLPAPVWADDAPLPTRVWTLPTADAQGNPLQVLLPDWSQISFSGMPPIATSGAIDGTPWVSMLGYDLSRTWQAGMTPDQYLKLGDIAPALHAEALSLDGLGTLLGSDFNSTALSEFPLAGKQTLQHLVDIVPGLGELTVEQVPPIQVLLQGQGIEAGGTLRTLVTGNATIAALPLGTIDLSAFPIGTIPHLSAVDLQQFQQWGNAFVDQIPGLGQLPLSQFPNPLREVGGLVMRLDMIYSAAENQRQTTISGSYQQGFTVPCLETQCSYLELDDLEAAGRSRRGALEGKQWISGKYQEVAGGFGVLGTVNQGKEPTGRHPFGEPFKVVVMEPDESTDSVNTALFFRFCDRSPVDLGCTPYFIGPVPFFSYRVNAPIFVGNLDPVPSHSESSQPTGAARSEPSNGNDNDPLPLDPDCFNAAGTGSTAAIHVEHLAAAIASVESAGSGGYQAVGVYTCTEGQNCGRALGRYQMMSSHPDAVSLITARAGGQAFLDQLNQGKMPTPDELAQYFPPADQDQAFRRSLSTLAKQASQQRDPTTRQPFTGDRLLERLAQMYFGGAASPIDGNSSDALGRLSLRDYGRAVVRSYRALGGSKGQVCVPSVTSSTQHPRSPSPGAVPVAFLLGVGMMVAFPSPSSKSRQRFLWVLLGLGFILVVAAI